ncbi:sensor histidine kinase [Flagellimonas meridianipacifica]|uniref:Histidine kinase n=1 Tax=Flagellimonas meridianipacifica TaxID=1080225 RepID=A0A2T0MAP1_9FLAO|nr:histidine kinase [Allomuricauda pacifica]PRX54574.1 histidine kinase [Allomuricauda pacifica]
MKPLNTTREIVLHILFWSCVFVFSTASATWYYSETRELLEVYGFRMLLQMVVAYAIIGLLIPKVLNKKRVILFSILVLGLFASVYALCTLFLVEYLMPNYPISYEVFLKRFDSPTFQSIFFNFNQFFSRSLYYAYPCIILMAILFYRERQELLMLHEKKREAELNALKNQLNPHFLFNTLNSLYLLALKKSDKTVRVIENLSHILDYMLYRCDKKFVLLKDELLLINKYIELEQIRYGKRVSISFDESITGEEKIAPLLLLTFVENAFKHGVSEAIENAAITIQVENKDNKLLFELKNTKPGSHREITERKSLGLSNIKKQLELLYPNKHQLNIIEKPNTYTTELELSL